VPVLRHSSECIGGGKRHAVDVRNRDIIKRTSEDRLRLGGTTVLQQEACARVRSQGRGFGGILGRLVQDPEVRIDLDGGDGVTLGNAHARHLTGEHDVARLRPSPRRGPLELDPHVIRRRRLDEGHLDRIVALSPRYAPVGCPGALEPLVA
jgi:hypothetical protein